MLTRSVVLRTALATAVLAALAGCNAMKSASSSSSSSSSPSASSASASTAKMETYEATLSGSAETPANPSSGTGKAQVQVDPASYKVRYQVTYSGLTGPASMGHIHGPAAPGNNAKPVVPFKDVSQPTISGEGQLTAAQYADLAAGLYYVNIHTARYPDGEIRGQLQKKP